MAELVSSPAACSNGSLWVFLCFTCRLQLLAQYQAGLLASLQLLGLAAPDLAATLQHMKALALTRAGLTEQRVRGQAPDGTRNEADWAHVCHTLMFLCM